jgi:chromosomal replication initiator protein
MDSKGVYDFIRQNFGDQLSEIKQAVMLYEVEKFRDEFRGSLKTTAEDWISKVCDCFRVSMFELKTKSRKRDYVIPRQIIIWGLLTKVVPNELTLEACGSLFERDHATALHSKKTIDNLLVQDAHLRETIMILLNEMGWRTEWRQEDKTLHKYSFSPKAA